MGAVTSRRSAPPSIVPASSTKEETMAAVLPFRGSDYLGLLLQELVQGLRWPAVVAMLAVEILPIAADALPIGTWPSSIDGIASSVACLVDGDAFRMLFALLQLASAPRCTLSRETGSGGRSLVQSHLFDGWLCIICRFHATTRRDQVRFADIKMEFGV